MSRALGFGDVRNQQRVFAATLLVIAHPVWELLGRREGGAIWAARTTFLA
jgi:hypothetical protein